MARSAFLIGAVSAFSSLSGCATYNSAPPNVEMKQIAEEGSAFNTQCKVHPIGGSSIDHNIAGAGYLINNFLYSYRCAARQVANGRQNFEVPAMAVAIGGAAAMAGGAPAGVAIGTGAATAGLNAFKSYYAPKDKVPILTAAVDSLVCIKNQSVGVDAFGTTLLNRASPTAPGAGQQGGPAGQPALAAVASQASGGAAVTVNAAEQYFEMIEAALLSVENVVAQRLSSVGSYSPDALMTELKAIKAQQDDADAKANDPSQQVNAAAAAQQVVAKAAPDLVAAAAAPSASATTTATNGIINIVPVTPAAAKIMNFMAKDQLGRPLIDPALLAQVKASNGVVDAGADGKVIVVGKAAADAKKAAAEQQKTASEQVVSDTLIFIGQLQPKLNECVLRAKL